MIYLSGKFVHLVDLPVVVDLIGGAHTIGLVRSVNRPPCRMTWSWYARDSFPAANLRTFGTHFYFSRHS